MSGDGAATTRLREGACLALPVLVPLAMRGVFRATTRRFGPDRGYQAGFAVYWATCWAAAGAIVGPRRLASLWRSRDPALPEPRPLTLAVLAAPALGAFATQWLPNARDAGPSAVAVAAGLAATNAVAEEALWHGVPMVVFPDDRLRGWLWPAVGFTAWHLVPLARQPGGAARRRSILAGAAAIGLGNGWVAQQTGSLRLVSVVHALTDACGVRQARDLWLASPPLLNPPS